MLVPALVSAQEDPEQPTYEWTLTLSRSNVYIGETLWLNVTGYPNSTFTIRFVPVFTNSSAYEWRERSITDENGTRDIPLDIGLDRRAGRYAVSLSVNDDLIDVYYVDFIFSDTTYNRLLIQDNTATNEQQAEQIAAVWRYCAWLGEQNDKMFWLCMILFFVVFFLIVLLIRMEGHNWLSRYVVWRTGNLRFYALVDGVEISLRQSDLSKFGGFVHAADDRKPTMPEVEGEPWECDFCGFAHAEKSNVEKHIMDRHLKQLMDQAGDEDVDKALISSHVTQRFTDAFYGKTHEEILADVVPKGEKLVEKTDYADPPPSITDHFKLGPVMKIWPVFLIIAMLILDAYLILSASSMLIIGIAVAFTILCVVVILAERIKNYIKNYKERRKEE